jgi:hypothetical protein
MMIGGLAYITEQADAMIYFENAPAGALVISAMDMKGRTLDRIRAMNINTCRICGRKLINKGADMCRECDEQRT